VSPGTDWHSRYYDAMRDLDQALDDALTAIRAEEDEHNVTPEQAAAERIDLMERHIAECRRLRAEHLGGTL
jgi:hypothetical protein